MVTVLLTLLQVYIVLGQASHTCEDEQDPTILPKSSYYATLRFCNLHISMEPIKGLPEIQYHSCTYSARRGLFFKWSDNSLAVVVPYESTYVIGIVPVDEVLEGKRANATVEMSSNNVFRFIGLTAKTHPQTCHRLPKEVASLNSNKIEDEVTIPLPSQGVYEPVLGSYVTEDGTSHVWIMHRSRVFYNINIEQYMKIGKAAVEAHRLEYVRNRF
ncbi:unnamed protein product [Angiostrongylus costaricensis]|uniref:Uncharacterized protein n=1 Tax=Angiostrongylus costaricensis TaxID=334426 RepID=A0A0R3PN39_ANGCS|nr:unnamed protein product [Angiostrongylus costaricensis]